MTDGIGKEASQPRKPHFGNGTHRPVSELAPQTAYDEDYGIPKRNNPIVSLPTHGFIWMTHELRTAYL